ncbi:hypothetical protein [Paenibacillus sp. FSL H8-0034]|uniref:hypothetical protein n=1 Tax=Paenibacillus sp. FSL H8-0034 TaxID=2954671 RepID=UPI0030FCFC54
MQTQRLQESRQHLQAVLERWYVWLASNPSVLFHPVDQERMMEPIIHLRQTHNWMSQGAIAKTEWFFEAGSQRLLERIRNGDYDIYE